MSRRTGLAVIAICAACSDEGPLETPDREVCLEREDGARYCINMFEESRRDASAAAPGDDIASASRSLQNLIPWVDITWGGAKEACEKKGKRLCERDEWIDACDGVAGQGGTMFTYGDTRDDARCNTTGAAPVATGSLPLCKGSKGTYDQSGNVWEWTGNSRATAAVRGGTFRSAQVHQCTSGDGVLVFNPDDTSPEVGFRCCRD
jgi:formylglycine-generating enzyme required for sulfatase activity